MRNDLRHHEDEKRGYPVNVGGLAKFIAREKLQQLVSLSAEERKAHRKKLLLSQNESVGAALDVLRGLDALTLGQLALLRARLRVGRVVEISTPVPPLDRCQPSARSGQQNPSESEDSDGRQG
ncbi:MAG: hypothetical protein JNJ54_35105 [Myxococcaceae bacterium]|nr:hypothetical protein [Myxococcaceae bacterium]